MRSIDKGSVLIISLIIMSIATSLSLFIIKISKDIISSSELILNKLNAKIKAESEIEKLKYIFSTGIFNSYEFKPLSFHEKYSFIPLDGSQIKIDNDISLSVLDTSAKLNLFVSTDEQRLRAIFTNLVNKESAPILTDSFLDWIDSDSFTRLAGAEYDYYKKIANYSPRNNLFLQDLEELLNIKGFSINVYKKLKKYLTLAYTGGDINLYIVDNKILSTISISDTSTMKTILNLKQTHRLSKIKKIIEEHSYFSELFSTEPSRVLEIQLKAKSGEAIEKIYCIIDFKETEKKPFTIYKYKL